MKSALFCLLALVPSLQAAPLLPSQIPPTAKWMLHADIDALRGSESGKSIFARIEAEHAAKLQAFSRMFSLHLLNDLHGVTLYGDGRKDRAVALIHGTLDRGHMEDVVKAADDYHSETYGGYTVHSWKDKEAEQHAAFANDGLLVFSRQEDLLRQALDGLKTTTTVPEDPFFAAEGGKPLIAASARLAEIELPPQGARLLRMAKSLHLAANENGGRFSLRAAVETADSPIADTLRRIVDGVIAIAQIRDDKLDGLDFRADLAPPSGKPGLNVTLSLPVAQWISLMEKAAAEKAAKKDQ